MLDDDGELKEWTLGFRIALGFSEPRLDTNRLATERRAWRLQLRRSEPWRSLRVITIGLFSGVWLFPWGWILLVSFFVYAFFMPWAMVYFILFLVFGGPLAFISSILLLFVSMSEYHRGILGFFSVIGSVVPVVLTLYLLPTLIINPFAFPFPFP